MFFIRPLRLICHLRHFLCLLLAAIPLHLRALPAAPTNTALWRVTVTCDTNGVIIAPTNFATANNLAAQATADAANATGATHTAALVSVGSALTSLTNGLNGKIDASSGTGTNITLAGVTSFDNGVKLRVPDQTYYKSSLILGNGGGAMSNAVPFVGVCTDGSFNTFLGFGPGKSLIGGSQNTFIGAYAGLTATNCGSCTFVGAGAGQQNMANYNTIVGSDCGLQNTIGSYLSFFGNLAGGGNVDGNYNSAFGWNALHSNVSGIENTAVGAFCGNAAKGNGNTFVGNSSGRYLINGDRNIFIGQFAGSVLTNVSNMLIVDNRYRPVAELQTDAELQTNAIIVGTMAANHSLQTLRFNAAVTADSYSGSGASLTNITAAQVGATATNTVEGMIQSSNAPIYAAIAALPAAGCTLIATTNYLVTGATYAYAATNTDAYTINISGTAPRYAYSIRIINTNTPSYGTGITLDGTWTPSGTNIAVLWPDTGTVWRCFGRGL